MGREYAREITRNCVDFMRVSLCAVRRKASGKRGKRNKLTSETQANLNRNNSIHNLTDHVNLNFSPDDCAVHLTYRNGDMPESAEGAISNTRNFIRCIRRLWAKKTGRPESEFKYIIVDEMSSRGRYHHHCIMSGGLTVNEISSKWRFGTTTTEPLRFDETGLCGISAYICKQRLSYRRWRASKNLAHPAERQNDYRIKMRDLRHIGDNPDDIAYIENLYPGWRVSPYSVSVVMNRELQIVPFVSFLLYKEDSAKIGEGKNLMKRKRRNDNKNKRSKGEL